MTAWLEERCEILPLLLSFLGFEDAGWVSGFVGVGIHVRHLEVYDALCSMGPKALKEDVSAIIFLCPG